MASEEVLLQLDNVHISSHLPIPKPPIDIEHIHHRVSQRWHTEQKGSYQHVGETFEPDQSWHQSPNNRVMDLNIEWSTWESRTEPIIPVVGSSSSSHGDDVYRPQFDYPQPSTYGQSMGVDSVTCWLSTTTISTPSFAQDMYSTPPPMQTMDDQLNQDE
ncbi:hypothetical protein V6N12_059833 [Hibiscus sabdariffa]|uniref:Uncharacterized protein n=1 Tax=Hibiscus sabdariffa TaxID=183260 RepID=A0ABR2ADW5_9ROSI